jgi:ADP-ribosylglycohydrolase
MDRRLDQFSKRSWLTEIPGLNQNRAPGNTCISALVARNFDDPLSTLNDSKGCGGVMRIAPIGLAGYYNAFDYGCDVAALTHGHPTGQLAAGCLASIIHEIVEGADLRTAIMRGMAELAWHSHNEETLNALRLALDLARIAEGTPEEVERLGAGWIAEEALAISVFCALVAPDLESALRLAVTHSGDSDSTGCITGHILGALHGVEGIPQRWLDQLDLKDVVDIVATDVYRCTHDRDALSVDGIYDWKRYPGR